jgi:hypothetical protein
MEYKDMEYKDMDYKGQTGERLFDRITKNMFLQRGFPEWKQYGREFKPYLMEEMNKLSKSIWRMEEDDRNEAIIRQVRRVYLEYIENRKAENYIRQYGTPEEIRRVEQKIKNRTDKQATGNVLGDMAYDAKQNIKKDQTETYAKEKAQKSAMKKRVNESYPGLDSDDEEEDTSYFNRFTNLLPKLITGRKGGKKRVTKKRSIKKRITKKRSIKKRITKKRSIKKRSIKKRITKKRSIKKRITKKTQ